MRLQNRVENVRSETAGHEHAAGSPPPGTCASPGPSPSPGGFTHATGAVPRDDVSGVNPLWACVPEPAVSALPRRDRGADSSHPDGDGRYERYEQRVAELTALLDQVRFLARLEKIAPYAASLTSNPYVTPQKQTM